MLEIVKREGLERKLEKRGKESNKKARVMIIVKSSLTRNESNNESKFY